MNKMKKLMIAAAIVCAAAFAQAATVSWGSGAMKTAKDADGGFSATGIKAAASASLFLLTESQYNTYLEAYGKSGDMSAVWSDYGAGKLGTGTAAATGKTASITSSSTLTSTADAGKTVYGALIYTYTDATLGKDFYIANIGTVTVSSEGLDAGVGNLGTYFLGDEKGTATGGWVAAVPEPTSGLLLLLGMAGLALRRRRA